MSLILSTLQWPSMLLTGAIDNGSLAFVLLMTLKSIVDPLGNFGLELTVKRARDYTEVFTNQCCSASGRLQTDNTSAWDDGGSRCGCRLGLNVLNIQRKV